jgi:hypothetical protein
MRHSHRCARRVKQYFGHQKVAIKEGVVEAEPYFTSIFAVIKGLVAHCHTFSLFLLLSR